MEQETPQSKGEQIEQNQTNESEPGAETPLDYNKTTLIRLRRYDNLIKISDEIRVPFRDESVRWIADTCGKITTIVDPIFYAVKLFDKLLTDKIVNEENYHLYAAVSLLIGIKINDVDASHLLNVIKSEANITNEKDITSKEVEVFEHLGYDAFLSTPVFFLQYIFPAFAFSSDTEVADRAVICAAASLLSEDCCVLPSETIALASIRVAFEERSMDIPEMLAAENVTAAANALKDILSKLETTPVNPYLGLFIPRLDSTEA